MVLKLGKITFLLCLFFSVYGAVFAFAEGNADKMQESLLLRNYKAAIRYGEKGLAKDPNSKPGFSDYYFLALAYLNSGITGKAVDIASLLLKEYRLTNLERARAAVILAYAYSMQGKQKLSEAWIEKACGYYPENCEIYKQSFHRPVYLSGWYQVGAFSKRQNAIRLAKQIKREGIEVKLVKQAALYKVRVQCSSQKAVKKIKDMGLSLRRIPNGF